MNTLMNIDPWSFLDDLLDTGSRTFRAVRARASGRFPPVNVLLDDNAVIIDMELPGRTAKTVELSLEPQAVVVADKPAETTDAETGKTTAPRPAWSRRLELPFRVDAVPNCQVGRVTPLKTRGDVALLGAFGYEMDPATFTAEELDEVRRQIAVARADEHLMLEGDFHRLGSPLEDNVSGWLTVSKDRREFVVTAVRIMSRPNPSHDWLTLRGLDADAQYRDVDSDEVFSGAFLMNAGLYFPIAKADFTSFRRRFRAV